MSSLKFTFSSFREGNYSAFSYIMAKHIHALTFHAYKYCKSKEVAEEIVADSFTKLWERRENFESELNVKAFLYLTTRNACLDYLKSQLAAKSKLYLPLEDNLLHDAVDPLTHLIHAELIKELHEEIKNLPQRQAQVFTMSYLEGASSTEICEKLNITPNAFYIAKKKATDAIKKVFSEEMLLILIAIGRFFQP